MFLFRCIPEHLAVKVLQKVDGITFIHFLKTCHFASDLANSNLRSLKFPMVHNTLHLYYDDEVETDDEFVLRYIIRQSLQGSIQGSVPRVNSLIRFKDFLVELQSLAFFKFSCICISETLQAVGAEETVVKTLEEMRNLRMKTKEVEMYNTELCNLAIEVLSPRYFRSDFQKGKILANCISETSLQQLECLDYYSDNREDAERTIAEILPNCSYLDVCFDFKCDWIWMSLMATIQRIIQGTARNSRLDLALFDTELPDFARFFENIHHRQYRQQFEDHDIVAIFAKITDSHLQLALLTRTGMLAEAVHYKIVGTFEEFQEFYTTVFRKEEYDFASEVETEIFQNALE